MRRAAELDDVGEIALRIVGRTLGHELGAHHAGVDLRQGVAVGLGILQRHGAQTAVGAGFVVGHHGLAQALACLVRDGAKESIG